MRGRGRAVILGAAGGAVATATMTVAMMAAKKLGVLGRVPPKKIAEAGLEAAGAEHASEPTRNVAGAVAHVAFGMAMGAVYALAHRRARLGWPAALEGAAFGTAVWAVSYVGWAPALGIMPPPHQDRRGRPTAMVLSHWVYGATLGAFVAPRV